MNIETPYTDEVLKLFTLKTESVSLNDSITDGQKVIMETILGRQAPDGSGKKRAHFLAHTRFGKSMAVGAAVAIRASMKGEKWAIVAPTKDQAQIIMDYVIEISVNDPVISELLRDDVAKAIKKERLTQRKSRNHITYLKGGEVRTYAAGATMGFGSNNVVLDEAGLIDNDTESKVFRMLGDSTDNFYVKIGNPWQSIDQNGDTHHFLDSFTDGQYFAVNYDYKAGLAMGRLTKEYLEEVKKKPNFDILYENIYPDEDRVDKNGYMTLYSHKQLKKSLIEPGKVEMAGAPQLGVDPNDSGENEAVLVKRGMNIAKIVLATTGLNNITLAPEITREGRDCQYWNIDKQGVGSGTVNILKKQPDQIAERVVAINSGLPVPDYIPDHKDFLNLRAFMFWKGAEWLNSGGRLEGVIEDWRQLLAVRYKTNRQGKVQIISKDELHKRGIHDLGRADAFSYTFAPRKKQMPKNARPTGGVEPFYNSAPDTPRTDQPVSGYEVVAQDNARKKKNEPYYPNVSF